MHRVLQAGGDLHLLERDQSPRQPPDVAPSLVAMLHGAGFQEVIQGAIPVEGGEDVGAVIMHARATPLAARPRSTPDR